MGFSLSKLVNTIVKPVQQVAKAVAPIASVIPGPIGMAAGAVTAAYAARKASEAESAALPGGAPIWDSGPMYGGGMVSALPVATRVGFPAALGGLASRLGGGIGGMVRAGAGVVRTAAGKLRGVMLSSGKFISSKKGAALAKRVGIDAAAAALGVSAVEMAEMVLADQESRGRGRNRGVSGADIKRTRRTIRKIRSMYNEIQGACRPVQPRRSFAPAKRAACPPVRLVKVK